MALKLGLEVYIMEKSANVVSHRKKLISIFNPDDKITHISIDMQSDGIFSVMSKMSDMKNAENVSLQWNASFYWAGTDHLLYHNKLWSIANNISRSKKLRKLEIIVNVDNDSPFRVEGLFIRELVKQIKHYAKLEKLSFISLEQLSFVGLNDFQPLVSVPNLKSLILSFPEGSKLRNLSIERFLMNTTLNEFGILGVEIGNAKLPDNIKSFMCMIKQTDMSSELEEMKMNGVKKLTLVTGDSSSNVVPNSLSNFSKLQHLEICKYHSLEPSIKFTIKASRDFGSDLLHDKIMKQPNILYYFEGCSTSYSYNNTFDMIAHPENDFGKNDFVNFIYTYMYMASVSKKYGIENLIAIFPLDTFINLFSSALLKNNIDKSSFKKYTDKIAGYFETFKSKLQCTLDELVLEIKKSKSHEDFSDSKHIEKIVNTYYFSDKVNKKQFIGIKGMKNYLQNNHHKIDGYHLHFFTKALIKALAKKVFLNPEEYAKQDKHIDLQVLAQCFLKKNIDFELSLNETENQVYLFGLEIKKELTLSAHKNFSQSKKY